MAKGKRNQHRSKRRRTTSSLLLMVGVLSLVGIVAAVGFMAVTGNGEQERRRVREPMVVSEERQVTVEVIDNDYRPRSLTIRPGTEVTWTFTGSLPHTVTDPGGAFDSDVLRKGESFTMTFDDPGSYYYYCTLHHAMQGTLIVAAAESAGPTEPAEQAP